VQPEITSAECLLGERERMTVVSASGSRPSRPCGWGPRALLLLGSRGYGPLRAVLLGGVSHVVVREAACPVIVLPRGARYGIDELFAPAAQASA
jgi:hypothetical protein